MPKKTLLIVLVAAVLLLALVIGGYLYLNKGRTPAAEKTGDAVERLAESAGQGVLPAIGTNPLENKPNLNPVDKTNPFKNIKINPFK
jgi:uncharacterized membrane protein